MFRSFLDKNTPIFEEKWNETKKNAQKRDFFDKKFGKLKKTCYIGTLEGKRKDKI